MPPGYLFLVDDSGAPRPTVIYNNGFDATAEAAYLAITAAALRGPTLVLDAEINYFFRGQAQQVEKALVDAPTTLVPLTEAEGAGEHCHEGAMARFHQVMVDWLDEHGRV